MCSATAKHFWNCSVGTHVHWLASAISPWTVACRPNRPWAAEVQELLPLSLCLLHPRLCHPHPDPPSWSQDAAGSPQPQVLALELARREVLPRVPPAVGVRRPLCLPPQVPDPPGLRISAAEISLSWTQTAKVGTTGMLSTSSSSRTEWRVRVSPRWTRRARMQGSPQRTRQRRPWTLWASCGKSPLLGGPPPAPVWSGFLQAPPSLLGV